MTAPVEVTAYCFPAGDLRLSGHGWSGSPRYLQSVSVTAGGIRVMTVYRDTDFFREDAEETGTRRVVLTSPERWLVLVEPPQDLLRLVRRTFLVPVPR